MISSHVLMKLSAVCLLAWLVLVGALIDLATPAQDEPCLLLLLGEVIEITPESDSGVAYVTVRCELTEWVIPFDCDALSLHVGQLVFLYVTDDADDAPRIVSLS